MDRKKIGMRETAIKASVTLLDIAERLGLLDGIDDMSVLIETNDKLVDKIYEKLCEGME